MSHFRILWLAAFIVPLIVAGRARGQDAPLPKPQSSASPGHPKSPASSKAAVTSILIKADADCTIQVDDRDLGIFKKGSTRVVKVVLGEHLIHAATEQGEEVWDRTVTLDKPQQVVVETELGEIISRDLERKRAAAEIERVQQQFVQSVAGQWKFSQSGSERGFYKYVCASTGKKNWDGINNVVQTDFTLSLLSGDSNIVEGDLRAIITRTITLQENSNCSYQYELVSGVWQPTNTATCLVVYLITGTPRGAEMDLKARYERSWGVCGDLDKDPRSSDISGTAKLGTPSELEWTSDSFDPKTAVLHKAY